MRAHSIRRICLLVVCCVLFATLLNGLQAARAQTEPNPKKIVLIGNQKFGDQGPMDAMAAGLEKCQKEFGFEVHKLESPTPAQHEEDVRAMAKEGYGLIMTTFPPMTDATVTVAGEYPKTMFAAIYQFVNVGGKTVPNVFDTDYQGQQATYLLGKVAGQLTKSKKLGYVQGDESEPIRNERNGFVYGVKSVCSDCVVEFASSHSFEDPVKGKEIALAMISRGVDLIETAAALTQLGVLEAAKGAKILFIGDVGDNYKQYPEGFVGYLGVDFGANVYLACSTFSKGEFPAGTQGHMDVSNGGYYVPWDAIERFAKDNKAYTEVLTKAVVDGKTLEADIVAGKLVIPYDPAEKPSDQPKIATQEVSATAEATAAK